MMISKIPNSKTPKLMKKPLLVMNAVFQLLLKMSMKLVMAIFVIAAHLVLLGKTGLKNAVHINSGRHHSTAAYLLPR